MDERKKDYPLAFAPEWQNERLRLALEVSRTGTYCWDIASDALEWDDYLYQLFGRQRSDQVKTFKDFLSHVYPRDRRKIERRISTCVAQEGELAMMLRITWPNGETRWLYDQSRIIEKDGRLVMIGACTDVTKFKRVEEQLLRSITEVDAANEAKSRFLANMSHEIRTPLAAIIGFSSLLRNPGLDWESRQSFLDIIIRNGLQLQELISDVLDLAKIESGLYPLSYSELTLEGLIDDIREMFASRASAKGLELKIEKGAHLPPLLVTDTFKLKQILANLLGNAIKFTDHGSVSLIINGVPANASHKRPQIEFLITDTGIGITPEQAKPLFKPFVQVDSSFTRKYGGTGLGLVLSRRIARALGGDVTLVSSSLGLGSTFRAIIACDRA